MKKLLLTLGALSILSTTAFSAVPTKLTGVGTAADKAAGTAVLPIVVQGEVIATTDLTLVVTPLRNAGVDGASMAFDFGQLYIGQSQKLEGTYKAEIVQNDTVLTPKSGTLKSELLKAGAASGVTVTSTTATNVNIAYALNAADTTFNGVVGAHTGTLAVVANTTGATAGVFTDNAIGIRVTATDVEL